VRQDRVDVFERLADGVIADGFIERLEFVKVDPVERSPGLIAVLGRRLVRAGAAW